MAGGPVRRSRHRSAGAGHGVGQNVVPASKDHSGVDVAMSHELQTAIVGATGYAGQELTRILFQHPRLKPPLLLAREGEAAGEIASPVDGSPVRVHAFSWSTLHKHGVDLLFLATPHEISRAWVPLAISHGLRVIDLSGAWRLHAPENSAVYGFDDIGSAAANALM